MMKGRLSPKSAQRQAWRAEGCALLLGRIRGGAVLPLRLLLFSPSLSANLRLFQGHESTSLSKSHFIWAEKKTGLKQQKSTNKGRSLFSYVALCFPSDLDTVLFSPSSECSNSMGEEAAAAAWEQRCICSFSVWPIEVRRWSCLGALGTYHWDLTTAPFLI